MDEKSYSPFTRKKIQQLAVVSYSRLIQLILLILKIRKLSTSSRERSGDNKNENRLEIGGGEGVVASKVVHKPVDPPPPPS